MKRNLILYSMQISMLKQLLIHKLISEEEEYRTGKSKLMEDYQIISDITG